MATCWLGLFTSMCEYDVNSQPWCSDCVCQGTMKGAKSVDRIYLAQSQYKSTQYDNTNDPSYNNPM